MGIEGSSEAESFGLHMRQILAPGLKPAQIVLTDNLSVHKSKRVRDLVEGRGCQLWLLPSCFPDMNPIEGAFSKARTPEALFALTAGALEALSEEDARGFFAASGYETSWGHSSRKPP